MFVSVKKLFRLHTEVVELGWLYDQCVYLSPKVLDVTACDQVCIKLQLSFLVASALHAHPALGYFLKKASHNSYDELHPSICTLVP